MNIDVDLYRGLVMPSLDKVFYGGGWHAPINGGYCETINPATGQVLGQAPEASEADAAAAIQAARAGFEDWHRVPPLERAKILRRIAGVLREHGPELALLDATNGGNPISEMQSDAHIAAGQFDFFAGLVTEMKGASIAMGYDTVNFSVASRSASSRVSSDLTTRSCSVPARWRPRWRRATRSSSSRRSKPRYRASASLNWSETCCRPACSAC